jgi:MFS family permease
MYMVVSYLGMGVGQQLLNFGNAFNLPLFYMVGLMLALSLVPVTLTHSISPQLPAVERINAIELFRKTPTGMLGCLCAGLLSSAFYAIGPVFCHQIGLSVSELTLVMTVTILGGMVLQWPIGTVSDRFDRTFVLIFLGFMVMLVGIVIFFFAAGSFGLLLVLMTIFGGLAFTLYPVAVARAHDIFEPRDIVAVSSVLLLSYGVGAAAGPLLASFSMAMLDSPYGLFAFCSMVSGGYALLTFFLRQQNIITVVAPEDNSDFVVLKSSSPVAATIIAPDEEEIVVMEAAAKKEEAAR